MRLKEKGIEPECPKYFYLFYSLPHNYKHYYSSISCFKISSILIADAFKMNIFL